MNRDIAPPYIRGNFDPKDRLAIVLVNKRADSVIQRLATAETIAGPDYQAWLRYQNAQRYEIYISMNALHNSARGRTKTEVAAIRHVYLDLDENGSAVLHDVFRREDLPTPSYVINTSTDKWQVIWRVDGFEKDQAEDLQKGLARQTGADPAATDCARVLRLPGFYNHKYGKPYPVRVEPHAAITGVVYRPENFPKFPPRERDAPPAASPPVRGVSGALSQSERDWAYAKRALARGEPEELVIAAIAVQRGYDKHNPQYYAELTVKKASESLSAERGPSTTPAEDQQQSR